MEARGSGASIFGFRTESRGSGLNPGLEISIK